jgi:hypothetical protein
MVVGNAIYVIPSASEESFHGAALKILRRRCA